MEIKQVKRITYTAIVAVIFIVVNFTYKNFQSYKNTIINQQVEHLHITSESIGRALKLYVNEKEKSLRILGKLIEEDEITDKQRLKLLINYYNVHKREIAAVGYTQGDTTHGFPVLDKDYFKSLPLGKHLKEKNNSFFLIIKIKLKNGYLTSEIELDRIHSLIVSPIKVGQHGYAVLKDLEGEILMHPLKDHIGENMVNYRKLKYPDANLEEVFELQEKQKVEENGSYIYNSYWWGENSLKKVKKISVFSRVKILSKPWVVSMIISYKEIETPIFKYLIQSILISMGIIFISVGIIFFIARTLSSREKYKLEMKYLKELNISSEKLRLKEAELSHSRRLETIGRLTRGIAHEFNNILTPIMGYSEILLKMSDSDDRIHKYSQGIYRSSERAREIIEQIRLFGGESEIVYEPLKIEDILREALDLIETTVPKGIKIKKHIKDEEAYIHGNETNIHQVILNICSNAFSAMKDIDNGLLIVECIRVKRTKDMIRLSFTDNGCGMSSEVKERIFDPFFTKKLNDKGSGIGLAVVQGIIEKHGGSIEVESQKGKGSTFHIFLPVVGYEKDISYESLRDIRGNEKILVVDDQVEITNLISDSLEEYGYSTEKYTDSSEVVRNIKSIVDKYDVVITDLSMPEIDGITLARRLREEGNVKIILITASSYEPLEEYLREGIIDDYLLKPATPEKIAEAVRNLFN